MLFCYHFSFDNLASVSYYITVGDHVIIMIYGLCKFVWNFIFYFDTIASVLLI